MVPLHAQQTAQPAQAAAPAQPAPFGQPVVTPPPVSGQAQPQATPATGLPDRTDFDPVTRALSDKNPPPADPNAKPAAIALTPEQQAEADRQKRLADIAQKREEAKKKAIEAQKVQKEKQAAAKAAEQQKMAAMKAARDARTEQMKQNRADLQALLAEQREARKAYQQARQGSTGDAVHKIEEDYNKAEADRVAKIRELRHPKFKPAYKPGTGNTTSQTGGTTALPGSVTSGTGSNVTVH